MAGSVASLEVLLSGTVHPFLLASSGEAAVWFLLLLKGCAFPFSSTKFGYSSLLCSLAGYTYRPPSLVTNRHLCSEAARQLRRSHRPACLVFLTVHEDADFARDRKGRDGLTTPTRAGATYEKIHNPGEDPNVSL